MLIEITMTSNHVKNRSIASFVTGAGFVTLVIIARPLDPMVVPSVVVLILELLNSVNMLNFRAA